jgi:glucan biosynthesis protein C
MTAGAASAAGLMGRRAMPRKYYLDWLRVIAFGLLILFHVGCLYASWPYNLKSPHSLPQIDAVLLALNPWRLALLFLISGVASRFLLIKLGPGGLAKDRLLRLVPVLLFAMFVVIPPQTFVELLSKGVIHEGYFRFWVFSYLAADQHLVAPLHKTMPTSDHLWFVVYLLNYSLILAAGAGLAKLWPKGDGSRVAGAPRLPLWVFVVAPALWLIVTIFLMERVFPQTFWVGNDWGAHLKWGGMFITGVLLAGRDDFWAWTRRTRGWLALLAGVFLALQSINHAFWLTGQIDPLWSAILWSLASGLFAWTMICALVGFAAHHLNQPSRLLSHLNSAILPVYVLHQPILLVAAYFVFPLGLPWPEEAALLVAITALGSFGLYEVAIRPFGLMRFLFGVKRNVQTTPVVETST